MILMNPVLAGDGDIEITRAQNRNWLLGEGFRRCVHQSNSWSLLIRYQAQAERHYRRAVEEFERLKALRPELPNEPISDANHNQTQPLTPHQTEPIPADNPAVGERRRNGQPNVRPCLRMKARTAPHAILKFPPHFSLGTHLESRFCQPGLSQKPR